MLTQLLFDCSWDFAYVHCLFYSRRHHTSSLWAIKQYIHNPIGLYYKGIWMIHFKCVLLKKHIFPKQKVNSQNISAFVFGLSSSKDPVRPATSIHFNEISHSALMPTCTVPTWYCKERYPVPPYIIKDLYERHLQLFFSSPSRRGFLLGILACLSGF